MTEMRSPQRVLARVALGGILVWCAPSQGTPPRTTQASSPVSSASVAESHRAGGAVGLPPCPLVSRSKRVAAWSSLQFPKPGNVNDGDYSIGEGTGILYASIYVFDDSQEMRSCCACYVSADGLLSESVNKSS